VQLLKSSWLAALIGGVLYLGTTFALIKPGMFQKSMTAQARENRSADDDPSWRFRNPDMDQWLAEIKHEKDSLALREQQVTELEARVQTERQELSIVTQSVATLQADFDKKVIQFKGQETENFKRQAKLMAAMSPDTAVGMLSGMSDTDAVKLLFIMKNDQVSELIETLSKMGKEQQKRAATLTERMRQVLPQTGNP
jgi:flagellar motility protein MotE (MotC chaperone)